ncbi:MAG: hypothetical protein IJO08_01895 [Clostridia bacterium]|nr:hypothetical protein [Clostridia bacterium]
MITSEELITRSKHFPRSLNGKFPTRPEYFSVDPKEFEIRWKPKVGFSIIANEGIQIVKAQTEEFKREYSIVFYGLKESDNGYYFDSFHIQQAGKTDAYYNAKQKRETEERLKLPGGEVIYGHSHVARGSAYNKFSLTDLNYYVKRSIETGRDIFAILITKDGYTLVMYSYKEREFFRVQD